MGRPYRSLSPDRSGFFRPAAGWLLALSAGAVGADSAELRLSRLIGDGMVVQRDAEIPVWGWAAPGVEVAVTLSSAAAGATRRARADAAGAWKVELPPRPAGGPFELAVAAGGERVVVHDVLVGDVWLCSGQSNMDRDRRLCASARLTLPV